MPSSAADLPVGAITRLLMATIGNWAYVLKCKLAVASARRREDPLKLAHTIRHLGDAYYYAGRWALAEPRSEEHTSELQSQSNLVCRLLLEKKKHAQYRISCTHHHFPDT